MKNIPRLAKWMSWLTVVTMLALAGGYAVVWLFADIRMQALSAYLTGIAARDVPVATLIGGFVLGLVPLGMLLCSLSHAVRFFRLYLDGDLFPPQAGKHLSDIGTVLLLLGPAMIVVRALSSVLFSLHLPDGHRHLSISLGGIDLLVVIIGGLVFMIGHLLDAASQVADDNRQIV